MFEIVSQIYKAYLLDQQLFCWRHFSKTEVVQNTDLNILTPYNTRQEYFLKWKNYPEAIINLKYV